MVVGGWVGGGQPWPHRHCPAVDGSHWTDARQGNKKLEENVLAAEAGDGSGGHWQRGRRGARGTKSGWAPQRRGLSL